MTCEEALFAPMPLLWTETYRDGANIVVWADERCFTLGLTWADLRHLMESFGADFENTTLADRIAPTPLGIELLHWELLRAENGGSP